MRAREHEGQAQARFSGRGLTRRVRGLTVPVSKQQHSQLQRGWILCARRLGSMRGLIPVSVTSPEVDMCARTRFRSPQSKYGSGFFDRCYLGKDDMVFYLIV
jgi:hypothetical protein